MRQNRTFIGLVLICTLLLCAGTVSAAEITVGSTGCDYTSISAAISAANPYDTIIVGDGTYTESLTISDSNIIIRSENGSATTIVNNLGNVFKVTGSNVTIDGFNVTGSTSGTGAIFLTNADECTLTNNTITGNNLGIYLHTSCDYNVVKNNVFTSNTNYGIWADENSNYNYITNNTAIDCGSYGFYIKESSSNTLTNNTVRETTYGIFIKYSGSYTSYNNTLTNNIATENTNGIALENTHDNYLINNTVNNNDKGFYLFGSSSNTFTKNIANDNTYGFHLSASSSSNILTDNNAYDNTYGILAIDVASNSFISNTAINNSDYDVQINFCPGDTIINDLVLTNNSSQVSTVTDSTTTTFKGIETSTAFPGMTNINGYISIMRSADVELNASFSYNESDLGKIDESKISLYWLNDTTWTAVDGATLDTSSNNVSATLTGFSNGVYITYGIFADPRPYTSGSGTIDDPYVLSTDSDIDTLSANPDDWGMNFTLLNDITLVGNHTPIGNGSTYFIGDFDGNGYAISNLTIYQESDYAGFFGYADGANIHDLGIETSSGGIYGTSWVAGLVGKNIGIVNNCSATGIVTGSGNYVGGLVGENDGGTISNSYATVNVSGDEYVGGHVGYSVGAVNNCSSTGAVNGTRSVGGLIGINAGTVSNSFASATVIATGSANNAYAGGLVGSNYDTVSNSFATGSVTGYANYVGGLVGCNNFGATISNGYATGNVDGFVYVGGLAGYNYAGATINNSFATGTVTGSSAGGFVGGNGGSVNYCYYSGSPNYNTGNYISYVNFTNFTFISGSSGLNWNESGNNITTADDSSFVWKIIDGYTLPYFQWQDTLNSVPYVETISKSSGINNTVDSTSFWINLTGCSFNITDTVFVNLTMDGQTPISGTIDSNTYTTINAVFNLTKAITGDWSLYVINPDGQTSIAKAFRVDTLSAPKELANNTGNFWVNHSWNTDASGVTDSYNISVGGSWVSTTNNYYNHTFSSAVDGAHAWSNITVYAYNATYSILSEGVTDKVQIPNNAVTILNVTDITVTEGTNITVDINSTENVDGDSLLFGCNRTDLFSFDNSSGIGSWLTNLTDEGIYYVEFNVSDGYGPVSSEVMKITVNDYVLSAPLLANVTNTTDYFYVNWTWTSVTNADSYNVSLNGVWDNTTETTSTNDIYVGPHNTSKIEVLAYNTTYNLLSTAVNDSVTFSNNPVSITNLTDTISVYESESVYIDANYTDLDNDTILFSCNRTDLFTEFNETTGEGSWQTNYTSSGTYSVNFSVSDAYGSTDSQVVTITVENTPTLYVGSVYSYTSIQTAINDAMDGDTIIVTDGTYNENVVVNKSIVLRSENGAENTIVNANNSLEHTFNITANNVTIDGFNITGANNADMDGICLNENFNCTISNNDLSGNYYGICLYSSNNNTLTGNNASNNIHSGIVLAYSSMYNNLTGNEANNNLDDGIVLYYSGSNTLTQNTMSDNPYNFYIIGSSIEYYYNDIDANNSVNGKPVYYLVNSSDKIIPSDAGLAYAINSTNITVVDAEISNISWGVLFIGTENSTIRNVAVSNCIEGIILDSSSNNNTLTNNKVSNNNWNGVYLLESNNNTLTNNNIINNRYGIHLEGSINSVLSDNIAMNNSLSDLFLVDDSTPCAINDLAVTENGAQISLSGDYINTSIKGSDANSTALSGKTNVNGYVTIERGSSISRTDIGSLSMNSLGTFESSAGTLSYTVNSIDVDGSDDFPLQPSGSIDPTMFVTFHYDDSGMSSSGEASIDLYIFNATANESTWIAVNGTSLDTSNNTISVRLSEFGTFGLFKDPEPSPSSSGGSNPTGGDFTIRSGSTEESSQDGQSPETTATTTLPTNSNGEVAGDTVVKSSDLTSTLTLYKGTVGTDSSGNPVTKITISTPKSMPENTPKSVLESGLYYDYGPSGATFSEEVMITIRFDPDEYEGRNPVIYTYNEKDGWIALETTIDWETGIATAYTTHFSLYALFGDDVGEEEQVPAQSSVPVEEVSVDGDSSSGYLYWILGIVVILGLGIVVVNKQKKEE